jgi:type IV fimbrial biogenesis protein FimT
VALTVFAILIGLAVPSFQNMMIRNRLATQVNELLAAVQTARSEALRRNQTVRFCTTATNWQMTLQADASVIKQSMVSPDATVGSLCADFRGDGLAYSTTDGSLMTNQPIAVSVKGQSKSLVIKMGSAYVE